MSIARKRWSPDEKKAVVQLAKEGYTQKQIAAKLRPGVKTAWRSIGDIIREDRKVTTLAVPIAQHASGVTSTPTLPSSSSAYNSTVELPEGMEDSFTAKEFMSMMDDNQRAIFVATYEDLKGDADEESVTRAENEMFIRASYSNVKYLRAQSLLNTAESYLMMELDGQLPDTDEGKAKRRFAGGRESYKKECEQWLKEYMDYLNDLKLTRRQRLDKIKDTRNTFLDLQQQLNEKAKQKSVIEDIKRIKLNTESELRRMAKGEPGPDGKIFKWLIGAFDDYVDPVDPPEEEKKVIYDDRTIFYDNQGKIIKEVFKDNREKNNEESN